MDEEFRTYADYYDSEESSIIPEVESCFLCKHEDTIVTGKSYCDDEKDYTCKKDFDRTRSGKMLYQKCNSFKRK